MRALISSTWAGLLDQLGLARQKLGLKAAAANERVGAFDNATVQYAQSKIPPHYKQAFRFDSLTDEDFFVCRDESLSKISEAKERWALGLSCSVGIFGPVGSGKTSLVARARQYTFKEAKVFSTTLGKPLSTREELAHFLSEYFQLHTNDPPDNIHDLAVRVRELVGASVAILEGVNLLFPRTIGGFHAIDAFFEFMIQTRPKVLWIVTMTEGAWRYLDSVKDVSRHFTHVINARNMDRKDLERVISVRHEMTGYDMEFVPPETAKNGSKQKDLRDHFFEALHEATDGNTFAALYYWLCSVERSSTGLNGERKVRIHPLKPLELDGVRSLNRSQAACLVAALQHGTLWPATVARVFWSDASNAAIALNELNEKRLLVHSQNGGFSPNPIVVPAVAKVLRERNLAYE